jgi:hypothetical protein
MVKIYKRNWNNLNQIMNSFILNLIFKEIVYNKLIQFWSKTEIGRARYLKQEIRDLKVQSNIF